MKSEADAATIISAGAICRTCMSTSNSARELIALGSDLEEGAPIVSVIGELTAVVVRENDGLPGKICTSCVEELRRFVGFIKKVRSSDRKLRKSFKGGSGREVVKLEVDEDWTPCKNEQLVAIDKVEVLEEQEEEVLVEEEYLDYDEVAEWKEHGNETTLEMPVEDNSEIEFVGFNDVEVPGEIPKRKRKRRSANKSKEGEDVEDEDVLDEVEQETFMILDISEEDYFCCACYNVFPSEEDLIEHCEGHREKARINVLKSHVCEICFRRYTSLQGLEHHKKHSQNPSKVYECRRCKQRLLNPKARRNHAHNHPKMEILESSVIAPIRIPTSKRSKGKMCCAQGCLESFLTDEELIQHSHDAHRLNRVTSSLPEYSDRPFECPVCFKRFYTQETLRCHQKRKYKDPLRQCSICGQKMLGALALATHERMHTDERPFQCSQCSKRFACSAHLKAHSLVHRTDTPFICSVCGKGFARKGAWQKHELIHTDQMAFECEVCHKAFRLKTRLELHMRIHTGFKPYECRYCEKTFADHSNRQRHEMGHTGIKPHKCSQCDKTFITKRLQAEHERSNHGIATVYTCSMCAESFTNRKSLNKHMQSHEQLIHSIQYN